MHTTHSCLFISRVSNPTYAGFADWLPHYKFTIHSESDLIITFFVVTVIIAFFVAFDAVSINFTDNYLANYGLVCLLFALAMA